MALMLRIEEVARRLNGIRCGEQWAVCCPLPGHAHGDAHRSASLRIGDKGHILFHCQKHPDAKIQDLAQAMDLPVSDFMADTGAPAKPQKTPKPMTPFKTGDRDGKGFKTVAVYEYQDADGHVLLRKARKQKDRPDGGHDKDFLLQAWSGGKWWTPNQAGEDGQRAKRLLYHLPEVTEAIRNGKPVFFVEGEKDVDNLRALGYAATCNVLGAGQGSDLTGKFSEEQAAQLDGADVILIPDHDEAGETFVAWIAKLLHKRRTRCRIVRLTEDLPDLPEKGDFTDWAEILRGHGVKKAELMQRLQKLIDAAHDYEDPQSDPAPAGDGPQPGSLDRFHLFNRKGEISGVFDFAILQHLKTENDLLIIGGVPWLYDGGVYRRDERGAKLSTMIRHCIYPQQIRSTTIQRVFNLFLQDAEIQATPEDLNRCPVSWICFRNGVFDPVTRTMHPHDPSLRLANQIPHVYDPDAVTRGDAVDEWLRFIAPDEDDREMLLEYAGLCLTRDARQQKFLILTGTGGTGKSTFLRLLEEMVGRENISSVSLSQLVTNRFASFDLLGRLVNSCADLEISALEDVSTLKKVLGEDSLRAEAKGRDAVTFRSYARLIFSTNELPTVRAERTNGFYRRLLVLPMNRKPDAVRADFFDELREDLPHLLRLCVDALGRMYRRGMILESRNSSAAVNQLRKDSDSVEAFLQEEAEPKTNERIERGTLYSRYAAYCEREGREPMQNRGFFKALRDKGLTEVKSANKRFFQGIGWRASALSSALDDALADGFVPSDEPLPFMRR